MNTQTDSSGLRKQRDSFSITAHDLNGPLVTARGFCGELEHSRQKLLRLLDQLPSRMDQDLSDQLRQELGEEMQLCLSHINRSLDQLDGCVQRLRSDRHR